MRLNEEELDQLLILWRVRLGKSESIMLGLGFVPDHYSDLVDGVNGPRISASVMRKFVDMGYAKLRFAGLRPFWKITTKGMRRLLNPESLIVDEIMNR